jgi:co-chaperonin GroES (HSP10)
VSLWNKGGYIMSIKKQVNKHFGKLTEIFAIKIGDKILLGYYEGDFIIHKKRIIINKREDEI